MENSAYGLIQLFQDGGFMMYPLLLASLLGLGVIFAKMYVLWVAHRDTRKVLNEVTQLAREHRLDDALAYAERTPGPVAAILLAGLNRVRESRDGKDIEKAMNSTGKIELGFLERGMVVLATVATVAPLMGFLGTVWGMIQAFAAIEAAGQVEATLVAAGIKIALITTATGLLIAIPINIAYNFFVTRVDQLIIEMEEGSNAVLQVLWDVFGGAAGTPVAAAAATRRAAPLSSAEENTIAFETDRTIDTDAFEGPEHRSKE